MRNAAHGLLLGFFVFATLGGVATADPIWMTPEGFAHQQNVSNAFPGATLSSIEGPHWFGGDPWHPNGSVYALSASGLGGDMVFGWYSLPTGNAFHDQWRGNWADMRVAFAVPVAYMAIQYQRSDNTDDVDLRVYLQGNPTPIEVEFPIPVDGIYTYDIGHINTDLILAPGSLIESIETSGWYHWPDAADNVYIQGLGYSVDPYDPHPQIPEPASIVGLAIGGLLGLLAVARSRRKRK